MPSLRLSLLLLSLVVAIGCADGGSVGVDSGSTRRDAGPRDDAGSGECPSGQHGCGGGCIDDLENLPENGCRVGCGEPCPTPPDGVAVCTDEGMCAFGCEPPFRLVDGECVCAARTCEDMGAMCGAPDDGCGATLDCGACPGDGVCTDGVCGCPLDAQEPNDSFVTVDAAPLLADIPNEDWSMAYTSFGIHAADDVDIYRFHVDDSGAFNPEPTITVDLTGIPTGADYDLSAFWVCDEGGNDSTCESGASDNERGIGCSSTSSGSTPERVVIAVECTPTASTNDSGTLYVRVSPSTHGGACTPYDLSIDITN